MHEPYIIQMLVALNSISTVQSKSTRYTLHKVNYLLDSLAANTNSEVAYKASDMILYIDSDATYLVRPGTKSSAGGHFYYSQHLYFPNLTVSFIIYLLLSKL